MKWSGLLIILLITLSIAMFEWAKFKKRQPKEKWIFSVLLGLGLVMALLLLYNPDLPGPSHLISYVFKPFATWLEHQTPTP